MKQFMCELGPVRGVGQHAQVMQRRLGHAWELGSLGSRLSTMAFFGGGGESRDGESITYPRTGFTKLQNQSA